MGCQAQTSVSVKLCDKIPRTKDREYDIIRLQVGSIFLLVLLADSAIHSRGHYVKLRIRHSSLHLIKTFAGPWGHISQFVAVLTAIECYCSGLESADDRSIIPINLLTWLCYRTTGLLSHGSWFVIRHNILFILWKNMTSSVIEFYRSFEGT